MRRVWAMAACAVVSFGVGLGGACKSEDEAQEALRVSSQPVKPLIEVLADASAEVEDPRRRVQVLTALSVAASKATLRTEAAKLLTAATGVAEAVARTSEREDAIADVAIGFVAYGQLVRAEELSRTIAASARKDELLTKLAVALAAGGDIAKADAIAADVADPYTRGFALVGVASALIRRGQIDDALARADKAGPEHRDSVLLAAALAHVSAQRRKKAQELIKFMGQGLDRSRAVAALAIDAYRRGQKKDALDLVEAIDGVSIRAGTLATMSCRAKSKGWKKMSASLHEQALTLASGLKDDGKRAAAFNEIAEAYLDASAFDAAIEVADKADPATRAKVYAKLIERKARAGDVKGAMKMIETIDAGPLWRADALGHVAVAEARQGQFLQALERARGIVLLELRIPILAEIAIMHRQQGKRPTKGLAVMMSALLKASG